MKRFLKHGLVSAFAFMLVQPAAARNLTVAIYEGPWGEAINGCIVEPFARSTGVSVTTERRMSVDVLTRLRSQRALPAIDIAWMDGGISELASAEGLLAPISDRTVPGVAGMTPQGIHRTPAGVTYALSTGFIGFGIVYNTQVVTTAPTSWRDLWKPAFIGSVTAPSPSHPMGVPLFLHLTWMMGRTAENIAPTLGLYAKLDPSSFADNLGAGIDAYRSGRASIGAQYANIAWSLADGGLPISYVPPKEGALGTDIRVHIVKGAKNMPDARRFVTFAVAKEQATCMAEKMYLGPASKGVVLSERARARMPWGRDGSIADLVMIDWPQVHRNQDVVAETWKGDLVGPRP